MITLCALVTSLVLSATPYPPPKVATVTEGLKCDTGSIAAIDSSHVQIRVTTAAGLVIYGIKPGTPIVDADGQRSSNVLSLKAGQHVRIYYEVDNGAQIKEIDLE